MSEPRAILVVEEAFLREHVGVLRVIAHYQRMLVALGLSVDFGVPTGNGVEVVSPESAEEIVTWLGLPRPGEDVPFDWRGSQDWDRPSVSQSAARKVRPPELLFAGEVDIERDYVVSVLTVPWISDFLPRGLQFTHALVYDLVPNLAATRILDLSTGHLPAGFAGSHHRGYERMCDDAAVVSCISRRTRDDFVSVYDINPARVIVDIPFDLVDPTAPAPPAAPPVEAGNLKVALVNALDPRKGIAAVTTALSSAENAQAIDVTIVGRERMNIADTLRFLTTLEKSVASVTWFRSASDALLEDIYRSNDVLCFPSIYEGLGLPVLEAQRAGLPCVTTAWSSLKEIAMNDTLAVDTLTPTALQEAFSRVRSPSVLRSADLATAQQIHLDHLCGMNGAFAASVSGLLNGTAAPVSV